MGQKSAARMGLNYWVGSSRISKRLHGHDDEARFKSCYFRGQSGVFCKTGLDAKKEANFGHPPGMVEVS
jgi:hypothetical protein